MNLGCVDCLLRNDAGLHWHPSSFYVYEGVTVCSVHLRARAEERVPDPAPVTPDVTPGNPDTPKRREPLNPGWDRYDREG